MSKVIKTESDYQNALATIAELVELDPELGTEEAEALDALALFVQDYELRRFRIQLPSPIEAIEFRMEQQGLNPRDLIPYLGSRSKVSEVLNGKRSLTLAMIRALRNGLGIPAEVLIQEQGELDYEEGDIEWERFPLKEMIARGWVTPVPGREVAGQIKELLQGFFTNMQSPLLKTVLYRKTRHVRSARTMDEYALVAWAAHVRNRALADPPPTKYQSDVMTQETMQTLARLSVHEDGPLRAQRFLREHGISLIIEPHLPRTHMDGAALLADSDHPVIGLSLRHDRVDNFWFSLMHEVSHVVLHLGQETTEFFDELGPDLDVDAQNDTREQEADELAGEVLIPHDIWVKSPASRLQSPEAVDHLAKNLGIHRAIVAGRMRHEFKAYRLFNNLVGHHEVRRHFPEINWS